MSAISERSIYGIINPLFAAAKSNELPVEHKLLYTSISTALLHLNSMDADRRAAISIKVNQLFAEHSAEDRTYLLNFLKKFSVKKANGSFEGFIKPLQEYFTILDIAPPQQHFFALALQSTQAPTLSPQEFMVSAFNSIRENSDLEKTLKTIFDTLSDWKRAAEKDYKTTDKMHLIDKTDALVASLKKIKAEELEYLQILFSQRYTENDWNLVMEWVAKNSFSEFDGAYKSLNDLMKLVFDPYFFPFPDGFGPESQILKHIDANKIRPGYNFSEICQFKDIRKHISCEPETLGKIRLLNKRGDTYFKEDVLHRINMGLVSNQDVGLQTIGHLLHLFEEEGCKKITRLDLALSPQQESLTLVTLKQLFPSLQHLSLKGGELNAKAEDALKGMSKLVELQLCNVKSFTKFNFLKDLTELKKLTVDKEIDMNLLQLLPKLEDLDLYIFDKNKSDAVKTLTHLKKLTLQFGNITDHSFLENFKQLTHLNLQAQQLTRLTLNNHPHLTTLFVEGGERGELNICKLPSLTCLSLKNSKIAKVHLENLPRLQELNLGLHYIDTRLVQNCNITKLQFTHNELLSDCSWLMNFPLEELDISGSNVSNVKMISRHPTLKTINIKSCKWLHDIRDLLQSKSLKTIILDKWKIDQDLVDRFASKGIELIRT